MKILLDTNVLTDFILDRSPFVEYAQRLFKLAARKSVEAFLTSSCITDVYYIIRKKMIDQEARSNLIALTRIFEILPVSGIECKLALDSAISDFEDALVAVCAQMNGIDHIITRDTRFISSSRLALSPANFFSQYEF